MCDMKLISSRCHGHVIRTNGAVDQGIIHVFHAGG